MSVAICAHNPRRDYLERTLESLRRQTLEKETWELLLVDNASEAPLGEQYDLSWHANGRVIRENTVGLIHARLRVFRETATPLIVFSDDDNELADDYLANAWNVFQSFPQLGAFGACIDCEFEEPIEAPREFIDIYRDANGGRGACWSNDPWHAQSNPIGAGLCLRREVATSYLAAAERDRRRLGLGRTGSKLLCAEDTDIVHHAIEIGFGKGIVEALRLVHLIPSVRTSRAYLLRLAEGHAYSDVVFRALKNRPITVPSRIERLKHLYRRGRASGFGRALLDASWRGRNQAIEDLAAGRLAYG